MEKHNIDANIAIGEGVTRVGEQQDALINFGLKLRTEYIPATITFAIAVAITNYDSSVDHNLEVVLTKDDIINTNDVETFSNLNRIQSTGKKQLKAPLPKDNLRLNWSLQNVNFTETGKYSAVLLFDNEVFKTSFYVEANKHMKPIESGDTDVE